LKAFLNTGVLYDGFNLTKDQTGSNRFTELPDDVPTVRRCEALPSIGGKRVAGPRKGPDGLPCTARGL
jgi:acid phosphatase type 7